METESNNEQDARVEALWRTLDGERKGRIDVVALRRGLRKMDHPLQNADSFLDKLMAVVDTNKDGRIEYNEFLSFVKQTEKDLWNLFNSIDHDNNGKLDKSELESAFARAGLQVSKAKINHFFAEVDTNRDGVISFDEWRDFLLFMPASETTLREVLSYYSSAVKVNPEGDVLISDDTIHGLGTIAAFLVHALFGSIIAVATTQRRTSLSDPLPTVAITSPSPSSSPSSPPSHPPHPSTSLDVSERPSPSSRSMAHSVPPLARPTGAAAVAVDLHQLPREGRRLGLRAWLREHELKPVLIACVPNPGYFLAGGLAGIVSRTATAPLDRLKVYLIAQTAVAQEAVHAAKSGAALQAVRSAWRPLANATTELWKAGGVRSLYAGNGLNVIKVMPESAIKFGSYEAAKRVAARFEGHGDPKNIGPWSRFAAGGASGLVSQFFVYPVDTIKFRMQCEVVSGGLQGFPLIVDTTRKMWARDGFRAFFRGLPMGLVGMFPYAAIDLSTFEYLKKRLTIRSARRRGCAETDDAAIPGGFATAAIGGFSGAFGASLVYPLNLLRTRLQSQGTAQHPRTYTGILDVTRQTIKGEGVRGLFKGLTPNLLKVVPAVSITYVVYEKSKRMLALH